METVAPAVRLTHGAVSLIGPRGARHYSAEMELAQEHPGGRRKEQADNHDSGTVFSEGGGGQAQDADLQHCVGDDTGAGIWKEEDLPSPQLSVQPGPGILHEGDYMRAYMDQSCIEYALELLDNDDDVNRGNSENELETGPGAQNAPPSTPTLARTFFPSSPCETLHGPNGVFHAADYSERFLEDSNLHRVPDLPWPDARRSSPFRPSITPSKLIRRLSNTTSMSKPTLSRMPYTPRTFHRSGSASSRSSLAALSPSKRAGRQGSSLSVRSQASSLPPLLEQSHSPSTSSTRSLPDDDSEGEEIRGAAQCSPIAHTLAPSNAAFSNLAQFMLKAGAAGETTSSSSMSAPSPLRLKTKYERTSALATSSAKGHHPSRRSLKGKGKAKARTNGTRRALPTIEESKSDARTPALSQEAAKSSSRAAASTTALAAPNEFPTHDQYLTRGTLRKFEEAYSKDCDGSDAEGASIAAILLSMSGSDKPPPAKKWCMELDPKAPLDDGPPGSSGGSPLTSPIGSEADHPARIEATFPSEAKLAYHAGVQAGMRDFGKDQPILKGFEGFYQHYALPCQVGPSGSAIVKSVFRGATGDLARLAGVANNKVSGQWQDPKSLFDLYTPRYISGSGLSKTGLCPICINDGTIVWSKLKTSAHNYHMNNVHGISSATRKPFAPPVAFRIQSRHAPATKEKSELIQGKCNVCKKWVDLEGVKDVIVKVPEIFWWKHAQQCHHKKVHQMLEPQNFIARDALYERVTALVGAEGDMYDKDG